MRDMSKGSHEKKLIKLLVPRCSGDGLQRAGSATPSLLPVHINVAVPAGEGEAGSVFTGQLETSWLCGKTSSSAKHL